MQRIQALVLAGAVFLLTVCTGQELPTPDKVYAIRSTMDGGLLYPQGGGEICNRLSSISFTYRLDPPYPDKYKWRVAVRTSNGNMTIHSKIDENGSNINDLTFDNNYPPYCYLIYREVQLIWARNGFIIRNIWDNKCLYSYGSEVGITIWRDCDEPYVQTFEFIEIRE